MPGKSWILLRLLDGGHVGRFVPFEIPSTSSSGSPVIAGCEVGEQDGEELATTSMSSESESTITVLRLGGCNIHEWERACLTSHLFFGLTTSSLRINETACGETFSQAEHVNTNLFDARNGQMPHKNWYSNTEVSKMIRCKGAKNLQDSTCLLAFHKVFLP